jgi:glucose/mannose-6-phosphate isomerase
MLDKDNLIQEIDSDNIRDTIADLPQQLRQEFDVPVRVEPANLTAVVIAGMGGSMLAGEMLRTWLADQLPVPIILVRGYELPAFVDQNTLVICSSYSGNTEETLGLYNRAGERQAQRVVIASGGQLHERGVSDDVPVYQLPTGYQPRMVAWYGLRALAELMEGLGFAAGAVAELEEAARFLSQHSNEWGPGFLP